LALVLAAMAGADNLAGGQEHRASLPPASAKLPFRIVERSAGEPSAAAAQQGSGFGVQGSGRQSPHEAAAAPAADSALPLKPRKKSSGEPNGRFRSPTAGGAVTTVITSLAVVLGLFLLCVLILRKANARGGATLPGEVVQTLGRAPLSGRQEMHLVRVGNKLLLLSVTASGAETLTEITDPAEIDRLAGICRQNHPDSITASFREILWQCGQKAV
jgi:flagellar biogenesis protein FliO